MTTKTVYAGWTGLFLCLAGAYGLAHWGTNQEPAEYKPFDFRTFNRTILPNAPGCEIRTPKGELLNTKADASWSPDLYNMPKGTTLTVDCFPILPSEKSTVIEESSNGKG